tara:strand:- start:2523 stop:2855 length:333 start_codon:yes stop_codon:yes gene_type:complete
MNLNEQLQQAYEAGRQQALNEQVMPNPYMPTSTPDMKGMSDLNDPMLYGKMRYGKKYSGIPSGQQRSSGMSPPGGWNTGYEGQTWEDRFGNFYQYKGGRWVHLSKLSTNK